ncbi:MAG TPA: hypothetical protein VFN26_11625 [Candidatus Acidoferrum sp.]|nr:hypothetical protein [Candidatus Acidoferrum sp.]
MIYKVCKHLHPDRKWFEHRDGVTYEARANAILFSKDDERGLTCQDCCPADGDEMFVVRYNYFAELVKELRKLQQKQKQVN